MIDKIKSLAVKYRELITYIIAGAMTTVISLGSFFLLTLFFLDPKKNIELSIANVISWILAVTFAYFINRYVVFRSKEENIPKEMAKFYIARLGSLLLDIIFMLFFVNVVGMDHKVAKLLVQILILITNYLLSKFLIFKKNKNKDQ